MFYNDNFYVLLINIYKGFCGFGVLGFGGLVCDDNKEVMHKEYSEEGDNKHSKWIDHYEKKIEEQSERKRSHSAISVASSLCSKCSGSSKYGMEYVCVNCINKELENERNKCIKRMEDEEHNQYLLRIKELDEQKNKYESELMELKMMRNKEMNEAMRMIDEKNLQKKIIE